MSIFFFAYLLFSFIYLFFLYSFSFLAAQKYLKTLFKFNAIRAINLLRLNLTLTYA